MHRGGAGVDLALGVQVFVEMPAGGAAVYHLDAADLDELKRIGDELRARLSRGVGLLATVLEEKATLVCVVTDDLVAEKKLQAGRIVGEVAKLVGGGGGGRPHMATAGGKDVDKLDAALGEVPAIVKRALHQ